MCLFPSLPPSLTLPPQISFNEFPSFPNRSYLSSRHQHHLAIVRQQWVAREKERALHIRNLVKEKTFKKQQVHIHKGTKFCGLDGVKHV